MRAFYLNIFTPLGALAAFLVLSLFLVMGWRIYDMYAIKNEAGTFLASQNTEPDTRESASWQQEMVLLGLATSTKTPLPSSNDSLELIRPTVLAQLFGAYTGLKEDGTYSKSSSEAAAGDIAENVRGVISYKTYDAGDIRLDADTSYDRMLQYRSDMRTALEPLLKNEAAEFEIFARYVETSDRAYLEELKEAAKNYRAAAESAARLVVPKDGLNYHRSILNAMQEFAAALEALALHADDPIAAVALLRTYNSAEEHMFLSFNSLTAYYGQKRI